MCLSRALLALSFACAMPPSVGHASYPREADKPADLPAEESAEPVTGRVLHVFDFEERDDGNYEDTPMHFARVTGMGMPHWVRGRLTTDAAHTGEHSFRLDLNGGSALYRLSSEVLPVSPGANYRVSGQIHTTALEFARARITAYCVDAQGQRLPESVQRSVAVGRADAETDWTGVDVTISDTSPSAAWLVIELGLLQPGQSAIDAEPDQDDSADSLQRFRQDVRGSAWFDDIVVSRVPTIAIGRDAPGGVFADGEAVKFWATARDAALGDVVAQATVHDAEGHVVWHGNASSREVETEAAVERERFDFTIGSLPIGWYEIEIAVGSLGQREDGAGVTRRRTAFVVVARDASAMPDKRFTVDASHLAATAWPELPTLLRGVAAGRAQVAVWGGSGGNDVALHSAAFDTLLADTRNADIDITATFAGLTPELEIIAGGTDWLALAPLLDPQTPGDEAAAAQWRSALAYLISRHAHEVDRWQLGTIHDADAFADNELRRGVYNGFADVLRSLVASPDLAMPWPARRSTAVLQSMPPSALSLRVPPDMLPRQIPLYIADANPAITELSLYIEPPNADWYGRLERLSDLAQRITYVLAGGVGRVTVPLPCQQSAGSSTFEPTEDYLVLRTLATHLSGLEYQGRVPAGDTERPVEALLFADSAGTRGVIVAWTPATALQGSDTPIPIKFPVNLQNGATEVNLWGVATPLRQSESDALNGTAMVAMTSLPKLVTGIDAPLTRLRQSVRLDDPLIESSFTPHARRLQLVNTYSKPITGTIVLRAPEGWTVKLEDRTINLNPGETINRAIDLQIPYNADAGEHTIFADLQLTVDGQMRSVRVPILVRVGLTDIGLQTLARNEAGDLIVEQTITNYGTQPVDYTAFVVVPDTARQERLIINLGGGQSTTKRYRFKNAASRAAGTYLRSGLRELEGTRILNDRVEL